LIWASSGYLDLFLLVESEGCPRSAFAPGVCRVMGCNFSPTWHTGTFSSRHECRCANRAWLASWPRHCACGTHLGSIQNARTSHHVSVQLELDEFVRACARSPVLCPCVLLRRMVSTAEFVMDCESNARKAAAGASGDRRLVDRFHPPRPGERGSQRLLICLH
jgi:hypothetical protein